LQRLLVVSASRFPRVPQTPLVGFPCPEALRRLAHCPPLFSIGNSRSNGPGDCKRDFVLHREDIYETAVVAFRPDVIARSRIDELCVDAHALTAATHTPL
jgi:hypothetical protein